MLRMQLLANYSDPHCRILSDALSNDLNKYRKYNPAYDQSILPYCYNQMSLLSSLSKGPLIQPQGSDVAWWLVVPNSE